MFFVAYFFGTFESTKFFCVNIFNLQNPDLFPIIVILTSQSQLCQSSGRSRLPPSSYSLKQSANYQGIPLLHLNPYSPWKTGIHLNDMVTTGVILSNSVVDPDPYWIRIQELPEYEYGPNMQIQVKMEAKDVGLKILINNSET